MRPLIYDRTVEEDYWGQTGGRVWFVMTTASKYLQRYRRSGGHRLDSYKFTLAGKPEECSPDVTAEHETSTLGAAAVMVHSCARGTRVHKSCLVSSRSLTDCKQLQHGVVKKMEFNQLHCNMSSKGREWMFIYISLLSHLVSLVVFSTLV